MSKSLAGVRIAALVTAVTLSGSGVCALSLNSVDAASSAKAGDIDGNGTLDASDCMLMRRYMLGDSVSENAENMDISGDGRINIIDYCMIKSLILNPPEVDPPVSGNDSSEYMNKVRSTLEETEPSDVTSQKAGVDYGTIEKKSYFSSCANRNKNMNVLLPAGYSSDEKYPVLYVLHGICGDESSMLSDDMKIQTILGNLTAEGKCKKMIVVFPQMFTSDNPDLSPAFTAESSAAYDNFVNDLTKDLMPYMEKNYSVKTGRDNTAVTGFSMGGREALYIGISKPEMFGYVAGCCPAPGIVPAQDSMMVHPGTIQESQFRIDKDKMPHLLMITAAKMDGVVGDFPEAYHNLFTKNGTDHIWQVIAAGDHGGNSVRPHMYNYLQVLFKAGSSSQQTPADPGQTDPGQTDPGQTDPGQTDTQPSGSKDPSEYIKSVQSSLIETEPSSATSQNAAAGYGTVEKKSYFSSTANKNKNVNVLLPAGYSSSEKYPVLYVLHGIFGDENSMLDESMKIQTIVGNLTSSGEAKKMIVVFPQMFTTDDPGLSPAFTAESSAAYDNFLNDLTKDLMPYMEKNYSIKTGRDNTAITGFSMGGREALYIGISRPELFGYIGGCCPAPGVVPAQDSYMVHPGSMQESQFKIDKDKMPYLLMITAAKNDSVVGNFPETYHNLFTKNGTEHVWQVIATGDHGGNSVRPHIYNYVKALFKN